MYEDRLIEAVVPVHLDAYEAGVPDHVDMYEAVEALVPAH